MKIPVVVATVVLLGGCSLIPDYLRPASPVSAAWPSGPAYDKAFAGKGPVAADIGWHDFFADPQLQVLIDEALKNNRDLRVAALNVEEAQAQRSEEHTSELQSLMRISYAVFC